MDREYADEVLDREDRRDSLIFTLDAISHLSREEFEILKGFQKNKVQERVTNQDDIKILPGIENILNSFKVDSIQEVVEIIERFNLFDLYHF